MHGLAAVDRFGQRLVDQLAHLLRGHRGLSGVLAAGYVCRAIACVEDRVYGLFDGAGVLLEVGGVAKDHGGGKDRAEGVRLAGSGDVGSAAVHGFVEIDRSADGGRRKHAERASDDAGFVGEDVSEEVLGEDHVEVPGDVHDVHRHGVDELVFEGNVGIVLGDLGDGGAPELGDLEYVGLVDGSDFFAALGGELESYAGYANDLVRV